MSYKNKQKEMLIFYICGKLPFKKLDKDLKEWILETPEIEELRKKIIAHMEYAEFYASKGQVNLMNDPLTEIEKLLERNCLYFPEQIKNNLLIIGLMNGIPREYKNLIEAIEIRNVTGINKHWKLFSNYVDKLESMYKGQVIPKGTKMVLERWRNEYNRLLEIISDPFHILK